MYLADLTQAAFEALESSTLSDSRPIDLEEADRIRKRILGVIIRQGRLAASHSLEECAQLLGADAQLIESWELGKSMPSLPQLEALSVCFNTPMIDGPSGEIRLPRPASEEYLRIRQRIVGVLLQSARQAREFTVADLCALTGIHADLLTQYEIGESTIPVHHLTILAQAVRQELSFFSEPGDEKYSAVRATAPEAPAAKNEDEEIQTFAADGRNRAFIRLAMAFRDIDREDLYRLASALLAIIREKRHSNGRPPADRCDPQMIISSLKSHSINVFLLLVTLIFSVYMLTYRAVIQSGDTLRALDAVTSQARYGDWLMDESNWFKPPLIIREDADLPLREYDVEERLNVQLAVPLLRIADSIPRLGSIHVVWLFNLIATSLLTGLIYFLARGLEFSQAAAVLVAITAGLSTNLWSYAQTFFREPLSAFFILAALLFICHGKGNKPLIRFLSLAAAAAGLYLAFLTKHTALFAIPAALVIALPEASDRNRLLQRRLASILCFLAIVCAAALMFLDPLPQPLRTLLDQMGLKTEFAGAALRSYLLSPGASIWGTSPVLLLSLAGCGILWRQQRYILALTVCVIIATYAIGHALTTGVHWFGGLSWPPRFLLPALPILMLATAPVAESVLHAGSIRLRIVWAALLAYGAWIQFNGVALSWSHFGDILPPESQGLAEWLPAMFQPQFFRWVLLPQRWADLGIDFLWTRAQLPIWGISFALVSAVVAWVLIRVLRQPGSRWRYATPLLAVITIGLVLLNLSAAYDRDPRTQSAQLALHEVRERLTHEARPNDILLHPSNDYGNFALNHLDGNWPRTIVLPRPLAQAASDRQPARVVSDDPNQWFEVPSLRVIQHLAARHDRLWLLDNTSPFMPWSFRPLERHLAMHYYLVREVDLDVADETVRLLEYATNAAAPNPMSLYAGDVPTDLRFGDTVRLLSYTLPNGTVYEPGAVVPLSLLWQTGAQLERDFVVATFVAEASMNNPVAQGYDSQPQAGFARTTSWKPEIPIWDNRAIRLPTNVKPGDYRLWVVLYSHNSETGAIQRLPVHGTEVTGDGTIGILPLNLSVH